ncbi:MAG: response regulator [Leptospiraceae bacterium]|nr:response regulator [Leptospiraceae bacterium]
MGLTIVSRLLQLMESKIEVKSELNKGSEFAFRLKLAIPDSKDKINTTIKIEPKEKNLKGLRILIVEDNAINIKVLEKFFSKWNVNIQTAMNGRIAVEKVTKEDFDVILMDLQMPEMDGYQASKAIRSLPETKKRNVPIIALTADAMLDVREKIIEAGIDKFLTKPFQPEELYTTLSSYLEK